MACRRFTSGIRMPAPREALGDSGGDRRVLHQLQAERLGNDFTRQVVVGGAEPAGEHDEVGAPKRIR